MGRTVVVLGDTPAALHVWVTQLRQMMPVTPHTCMFQSRKGRNRPLSPVQARRILHGAVTTDEITGELGTHMMRKAFANRVDHQLNHDLVKTQRAMGPKNINSTVAYLSFIEDEIDQAILAS
jgi:site-specific recombinase XerD